jgi:hypothetical protein
MVRVQRERGICDGRLIAGIGITVKKVIIARRERPSRKAVVQDVGFKPESKPDIRLRERWSEISGKLCNIKPPIPVVVEACEIIEGIVEVFGLADRHGTV